MKEAISTWVDNMQAQISLEMLFSMSLSFILFSLLFSYAYTSYLRYLNQNFSICEAQNIIQLGLANGYIQGVEKC